MRSLLGDGLRLPKPSDAVNNAMPVLGIRTMTIDPKTHRVYLPAATPVPAPAGAQTKGGYRVSVPDSFVIVVAGD